MESKIFTRASLLLFRGSAIVSGNIGLWVSLTKATRIVSAAGSDSDRRSPPGFCANTMIGNSAQINRTQNILRFLISGSRVLGDGGSNVNK